MLTKGCIGNTSFSFLSMIIIQSTAVSIINKLSLGEQNVDVDVCPGEKSKLAITDTRDQSEV